ncbi:MAG: phosphonate dehydrogenase [Aurantimonas endophytica]|uniref:phosphonate dehydrogenase n=1 Tax=Aurantimonas endophytica TaxID=1522175 RepID=UPI003002A54B
MNRPLIVATSKIHTEVVELLSLHGDVVANVNDEPWAVDRLSSELREARAVMAFMPDRVDNAFLEAAPNLEIVACALKGFDNFDVATCTARGVWVSIVEDLLTDPTAELTVGLMIGLARHIMSGDVEVRRSFDGWRPRFYGTGLSGSCIGLLGMGAIGQALAKRLRGFGSEIVYWDRNRLSPQSEADHGVTFAEFNQVVAKSTFLISALPLTTETRHMVDAAVLAAMPGGAFLVNPSRGSVVDEAAVADALESGRIAGYAADVFEMEDWAIDDRPRQIEPRLLAMPDRTLFTPHLGSAVQHIRLAIEMDAAANIIDVLEGRRPRGAINDPVGLSRRRAAQVSC